MDYSRFLQESKRVSGSNKPVLIVNPDLFTEFLDAVAQDTSIASELKAFILLAAGCGGRVSELLAVHKWDVTGDYFEMNVLKKPPPKRRKPTDPKPKNVQKTRNCRMHPAAVPIVQDLLRHRKPQEFLFKMNRFQALYQLKKLFGEKMDCHAFRHTHISYLMSRDMTDLKIAKLIDITTAVVSQYAHLNQKRTLEDIF